MATELDIERGIVCGQTAGGEECPIARSIEPGGGWSWGWRVLDRAMFILRPE